MAGETKKYTMLFDDEDGFEEDQAGFEDDSEEEGPRGGGATEKTSMFDEDEPSVETEGEEELDAPKAEEKTPAQDDTKNIINNLADMQGKVVELLAERNKKPAEADDAPKAKTEEDIVKALVQQAAFDIPPAYIEAITGEDRAAAAQSLQKLMVFNTERIIKAMLGHTNQFVSGEFKSYEQRQREAMEKQTQAQSYQQQIEMDFKTRYDYLAAFENNKTFAPYLTMAVQQATADPQAQQVKSAKEFSDLIANKMHQILKPMFHANGKKYTKANLERLLAPKDKEQTPPARLGTARSTPSKRKADSFGFDDSFFENL